MENEQRQANDATKDGSLTPEAWQYLADHRIAHLATVDASGHPSLVPLCFATDSTTIYSALDDKPKRVQPENLRRVHNITAHPEVALLVDDYSEDWTQLAYLLIKGQAEIIAPGGAEHAHAVALLRAKYQQYQQMPLEQRAVIRIHPVYSHFWRSGG